MSSRSISVATLCILSSLTAHPQSVASAAGNAHTVSPSVAANYGKLPMSFEANQGQTDPEVKFLSRGNGYSLFLTDKVAVLALTKTEQPTSTGPGKKQLGPCTNSSLNKFVIPTGAKRSGGACVSSRSGCPILTDGTALGEPCEIQVGKGGNAQKPASSTTKTDVIRMELAGANPTARVVGEEKLPGIANYFIGDDPNKWHSNVPTYARVDYKAVYPGIDLTYYGSQQQLEYDFVIQPGADASLVRLHFAGSKKLKLNPDGDLTVVAPKGEIAFHQPVIYQLHEGKRTPVQGRFSLLAKNSIGFSIGAYDHNRALVIDPTLAYSTYLGGSGLPIIYPNIGSNGGQGTAIAVDNTGNTYVVGSTAAVDFPTTPGAFQTVGDGGKVSVTPTFPFVAKLDYTGSTLLYATYLSGSGYVGQSTFGDSISGIAVDSSGKVYVTGATYSTDFPVTSGAYQATKASQYGPSCFVTKLNPNGATLDYSTFLSGSDTHNSNNGTTCSQVALDAAGDAYLTGATAANGFPVTSGVFQPTLKSGNGNTDAFVTKLNPTGSALVYSSFLGGSTRDSGSAIVVDAAGDAYVTGQTLSTDFPFTTGAYRTINEAQLAHGESTGFVAKVNPTGTALVYATYIGGTGGQLTFNQVADQPTGIGIDLAGDAYITGITVSQDYPVTTGALQTTNRTYASTYYPYIYSNAFVTKFNPTGTALVFSTYLGSSGGEAASSGTGALAVDASGNVYVTGTTYGIDFPVTTDAFESANPSTGNGVNGNGIQNQYYGEATSSAYLTILSATGALQYSTYLGGSGMNAYQNTGLPAQFVGDFGSSVVVDPTGNAYLTGIAESNDFPTTTGSFLASKAARYNAFISKFTFVSSPSSKTLTTLLSSANPQTTGAAVAFTAYVQPTSGGAVPTGSITFRIDGAAGTSVALDATGHASSAVSTLPDGPHVVTAHYSGNASYSASSASLTEVIAGTPATVSIVSGSGQTTLDLLPFPDPVVALVQDANGNPVANAEVVFTGSGLAFIGQTTNPIIGYTGFDGKTSALAIGTAVGSTTGLATVQGANAPAFFPMTVVAATGVAATPTFSVPGGSYPTAQTVTLSTTTPGATIYYTNNGNPPTTSSFRYDGPITVSSSQTIQAIAAASGFYTSAAASATYTIASTGALQLVNIAPCRVADTRNPTGPFGAPALAAGVAREFDIPQSACNIPSTALAYSLNVTVVPDGVLNYLTLWPTGQPQPNVSTLNSLDGRVKANAAITPAGTNGGVSVFADNATNVILDIDGYFVPSGTPSAMSFAPITPCRVADTRRPADAFNLGGPFLAAGTTRIFPVLEGQCAISYDAQAYSLNVTVVPHTILDYLTIWPTGQPQPTVSTLNATTGTVTANAAIVPAASNGEISIYVSNDTDVILDVNGYFAQGTGGLKLYTTAPCRVLDTRNAAGAFNGELTVGVEGSPCSTPAAAQAYVLNATIVPPGVLNYLTLWPDGLTQPVVSTLNAVDGAVTSNMAIVPTSNGNIDAFSSNSTQLILDLSSYFAP